VLPEPNKIHLACGGVRLDGWLNVDLDSPVADLRLDLREKLPFADGSAAYLFSEHFIEHLTRAQGVALLAESHRVLAAEGVLRISTPDLKFLAASYLAGATDEWGELWCPATPSSLMNEGMRSWGHQFLYDANELIAVLREAGFRALVFVAWRQSLHGELAGLESRPFHNELIVEARKAARQGEDFVCDSSAVRTNESRWLDRIHSTTLARLTSDCMIAEQARQIGDLEQALAERWQRLEARIAECAARGEKIAELERALTNQGGRLRTLAGDLAVRAQQVFTLERLHAEQATRAHRGQLELAERGRQVLDLERELAEQVRQNQQLEAELGVFRSSWFGRLQAAAKRWRAPRRGLETP
jgi:predicted SAM-dependent methyltransferase